VNRSLLDFIVSCADRYFAENLAGYDRQKLETDWLEAFDFLLWHICYQGRKDEMSKRVYDASIATFRKEFSGAQEDMKYALHQANSWNDIRVQLGESIGKGKVGKARDVEMIVSALGFIGDLPQRNIVAYSVARINDGHLKNHFLELQAAESCNGITQVGPKVAAFYLRDIVSLFKLEGKVDSESTFALVPVDTWVRQVATKVGITDEEADSEATRRAIVKVCEESGIQVVRFNQGAWYIGNHALELILNLPDPVLMLATSLWTQPLSS
jgi:hypothetical protein